ncbi:hypothetical protein [Microlunatus soli]|uniref:PknH-like extracellular domain-containing protein n=1 Tax=Microlunatus soli TaxID=630515 RepID=A0A1H2AMC6_9ACTN|nr:hypothetical protein [Microlunatus soli]SDT46696.1 hypothetical protein SAMN04489812_6031 [Microlunatus soli]
MSTNTTRPAAPSGSAQAAGRKGLAARAALALAVAAGAAVGLSGFGLHSADAASTDPIDTVNLIQGRDFSSFKDNVGELNQQTTDLYGAHGISACTGEDSLDTLTGNKDLTSIGSTWSNADGEVDGLITEAIVEAKTPAAAKAAAATVVAALKECQTEPEGHWHYGKLYNGPLKDGDHVWMDSIDGDTGKATGGVSVMLHGNRFGIVEVQQSAGSVGDGDDAIKNVSYEAELRLAD